MTIYRCQYHNKIWFDKEKAFKWIEDYYTPHYSREYATRNYKIRFTDKEDRRIYHISYELCASSDLRHLVWVKEQCTVSWKEVEE